MVKSHGKSPRLWPPHVEYIAEARYSKTLKQDQQSALYTKEGKFPANSLRESDANSCNLVRIRKIVDSTHPAFGQHGLYAARHLPPNTIILPYLGFVHGPEETDEHSNYDLTLDRELGIGVDANKAGNEARFINDYRGVSQSGPNAEFRDYWVSPGQTDFEKRIGIYVLSPGKSGRNSKGIAKGEEILVSYGKGFWNSRKLLE